MNARENKTGEVLVEPLTRREREILVLLARGYSGPEIAQQLTLALSSVKWYVQQVYSKLGVHNKQQAIIRAGELGLLEMHSPVTYVHFSPKHNLPSQLTSFIGREQDVERIQLRLTGCRLVTLIGVGGIGKTRLCQQVANQLIDHYSHGVWLVEFAALNHPALVPQNVATVFGIQQRADHSALVETIIHFLNAKTILLVLDNCEHLLEACAGLADKLLKSCPNLKILATSREALGVAGEIPYLVPTLTTPDPAQADLPTLPQYEAVRLFVERAQTALQGFELTIDNTPAVAQVCHQLDGIPLALELAAARLKLLRVEQIASHLENRFDLLTGGSRTALPRHQTLHALIDWSHDLLLEPERALLRRLAVFAGGWTLEATKVICVGDGIEAEAVLDLLTQLVNKSLLLAEREQGQETRYRMLETIRQYASEQLLTSGEADRTRNWHFEYFRRRADRIEPLVRGPQQLKWLDHLESENDNLRAALEWSLTQAENGEASLWFASALLAFWHQRGHVSEGRAWLARALASPAVLHASSARAKALDAAGFLAREQGEMTIAKALLEESAGLWRTLGSAGEIGLARALTTLGEVTRGLGDPATARSIVGEAIALFREQDERWGLAYALSILGIAIRDQEEFVLARSVLNESLVLWREIGDQWGLRLATRYLGMVALRQGDYEIAQRHYADCLAIARKLGDKDALAEAFLNLGVATLNLGDRIQAKEFFEECFSLFRESGDKAGLAETLYYFGCLARFEGDNQQAKSFFEQQLALARTTGPLWLGAQALRGLAGVAAAGGQASRAVRLLGASEARAAAAATYNDAVNSLLIGSVMSRAITVLGEVAFAAARAEGRAMTFEQAADYALEEN